MSAQEYAREQVRALTKCRVTCRCCGVTYLRVPKDAKEGGDGLLYGWYFTCPAPCSSTHFVQIVSAAGVRLGD